MLYLSSVFAIILLVEKGLCEQPLTTCLTSHPFRMSDSTCANFRDVCFVKNNDDCDLLQEACKQCPPSNYTENLLLQLMRHSKMLEVTKDKKINELSASIKEQNNKWFITVIVIITTFGICFIISVVVGIFNFRKKDNSKKLKSNYGRIQRYTKIPSESICISETRGNTLFNQEYVIEFLINESNLQTELNINYLDNIVEIKKRICSQLSNANDNNYKIMRLKYNGNILDDNRYLLPYITDRNTPVHCEIDRSINDQEIVILQLEANIDVPKLIQLVKNNTIGYLRKIIYIFTEFSDYVIVKKFKMNESKINYIKSEVLKDELTIEECNLTEENVLYIIKRKGGRLSMKSMFQEEEELVTEYSNTKYVLSIKRKLSNKFNSNLKDFYLFLNKEYLDDNKYIFEYNINENSPIECYHLMRLTDQLDIEDQESIDNGYYSKLYIGKHKIKNKKTLIMKFEFSNSNEKKRDLILNAFIKYQKVKSSPRFVKLYGVYYDNDSLYVSMEYLGGRTLTSLKSTEVTEEELIKWSAQILEGIKYLHDNNIILKDLKPYEIIFDENRNLIMHSFCVDEHLDEVGSSENVFGIFRNTHLFYTSPELRNNKPFDKQTDVWSFGVTLIYIINCKCACINLNEIDQIVSNKKLKEVLPKWLGDEMKDVIDSCLRMDPNERSTVDQLLKRKLLRKNHQKRN